MLHLYHSNRLERLLERLCRIIVVPAGGRPLRPEIIVAHNPGMARWLAQQIATHNGVSANLSFPLPARFVWELFNSQLDELPDQTLFSRAVLIWRIADLLPEIAREKRFADLRVYLDNDPDGYRLYQLADRVAGLFDKYLVYRPDMLIDWEKGRRSEWQAVLWRRLAEGPAGHRARLSLDFLALGANQGLKAAKLPPRVFLFGLNSLPPVYLEVLATIGQVVDVHLFHLNPCRQFWGDLVPAKALARRRASGKKQEDGQEYLEQGHPLLSSLGRVGQEFFSMLMAYDWWEEDLYADPEESSLLASIQRDILDLRDRSAPGAEPASLVPDRSVQFHICHSPLREIQVLHDRLLDLFTDLPGLRPGDVLVMAPDITRYRAAVQAVFGTADEQLQIPWSMADLPAAGEHPIVSAFLFLLALPSSRYTAPDVLDLLETDGVRNRFVLTREDLETIRSRLDEAGIRWGLDGAQRQRLGIDMGEMYTWKHGLRRLLLGYAVGGEEMFVFQGLAPCTGVEEGDPSWLGGLAEFVGQLESLDVELGRPHLPGRWQEILFHLLDSFFLPGSEDEEEALQVLREEIFGFADQCARAGYRKPVSRKVVRALLCSRLTASSASRAFLTGRVTFCNMVPMRSLPFRVICLLGMNDTDFPRIDRPLAYDFMALDPRPGDRSRRDDDRYLFLEALLSARDVLYISWQGRDQQDNRELPASVVVDELRDYIDQAYGASARASRMLTYEYPLQPFSVRCYGPPTGPVSYDDRWLPRSRGTNREQPVFLSIPLADSADPELAVDLEQFVRFWSHPVRFFLRERLGIQTGDTAEPPAESEPFSLSLLEEYLLASRTFSQTQEGTDHGDYLAWLQQTGILPHGPFGTNVQARMATELDRFRSRFGSLAAEKRKPVEVDWQRGPFRLCGRLDSLYSCGRITMRLAKVNGRDRFLLWVHHLVLQIVRPEGVEPVSMHLGKKRLIRLEPVADPVPELERLLHLYREGLRSPLHFYPVTSYKWITARTEKTRRRIAASWSGRNGYSRAEGNDEAYRLALRGQEPLDDQFVALARLFEPLLRHIREEDAAA